MKKPSYYTTNNKGFVLYTVDSFENLFKIPIQSFFNKPSKLNYHFLNKDRNNTDLIDAFIEEHQLQDHIGCVDFLTHTEIIYENGTVIDVVYTDVEQHIYFVSKKMLHFA